jgi:hypothetical protein
LHPRSGRLPNIDKDTVSSWACNISPTPSRRGADDLPVHPTWSRWVTGGTERGSGGVEDQDTRVPWDWALMERKFVGIDVGLRVELIEEKVLNELE